MAQSAKTKTALKNTVAVIEPTPGIGHNQPQKLVMDDRMIRAIALHAFEDDTKSKEFSYSAVQRLCAAVLGQYAAWDSKGHPDSKKVPNLAECYLDKAEMSAMMVLLREKFLEKVPSQKKVPMQADIRSGKMDVYNKRNSLLGRATMLASIFSANGVTIDDYKDQSGLFAVPRKLFKPKDCEWVGLMARQNDTQPFLLNGRVFSVEYENSKDPEKSGLPGRVAASVDAVVKAWKPVIKRDDGVDAGQGATEASNVAKKGLGQLFTAIRETACDPKLPLDAKAFRESLTADQLRDAMTVRLFLDITLGPVEADTVRKAS